MYKLLLVVMALLAGVALVQALDQQAEPQQPQQPEQQQPREQPQQPQQPREEQQPRAAQPDRPAGGQPADVDIQVGQRGGLPWTWIIIGLVVLVLIIGLVARGGGTERVERVEHHDDTHRAA